MENLHHQREGDKESVWDKAQDIKGDKKETPHPAFEKKAKKEDKH